MQSKYDIDFKKEVLKNNGIARYRELSKYKKTLLDVVPFGAPGEVIMCPNETYDELNDFIQSNPALDCAKRLIYSRNEKTKRVREKITGLVKSGRAIFVTLNFKPSTLENTTEMTRRRLVARFLKANSNNYVANVDYGEKRGREHYHAVVDNNIDFTSWYKYGGIKVERVRTQDDDATRIAKYITKLTNHAIKNSTCPLSNRLIYSRN